MGVVKFLALTLVSVLVWYYLAQHFQIEIAIDLGGRGNSGLLGTSKEISEIQYLKKGFDLRIKRKIRQ